MFNYSSPSVKKFSLASTCQYPPQIGRLAPIWHMVQSSAASPSLFSWPASTPEEHGNTHRSAHSQKTHARSQNTHTLTHTHTHTHTVMMQFVCQFCLWDPSPYTHTHIHTLSCWALVHKLFATGFKVFSNGTVHAATAKSATAHKPQHRNTQKCPIRCWGNIFLRIWTASQLIKYSISGPELLHGCFFRVLWFTGPRLCCEAVRRS